MIDLASRRAMMNKDAHVPSILPTFANHASFSFLCIREGKMIKDYYNLIYYKYLEAENGWELGYAPPERIR
jgi:hypothetical protein